MVTWKKTGTLDRIQRIILNETATVLILSAFVAFGLFGYLNVYAIVLETALLLKNRSFEYKIVNTGLRCRENIHLKEGGIFT